MIKISFLRKFIMFFYAGIENSVPRRFYRSNQFPNWYDNELISLIFAKKKLHLAFKIYHNEKDKKGFELLRAVCKSKTRSLYNKFLVNTQNSIKTNVKNYWSYVNKLRTTKSIPSKMYLAEKQSQNDFETANLFENSVLFMVLEILIRVKGFFLYKKTQRHGYLLILR